MDLLQLKYFQVVARLENMTRAAQELHIAQPSLSKTISRLEESVGVLLFDRVGKRIRLNRSGEIFLNRVNRSFDELEDGRLELAEHGSLTCKSISVGASSSRLLPDLLKDYLTQHSDVKFRLRHITKQQEMQKQLLNGEIDLSIFFLPMMHPDIHCESLLSEEIVLAVPPNHPLAKLPAIELKDLVDESFISVTTDFEFREIINKFCLQAGFTPRVSIEIDTLNVLVSLVNAGLGIAFLPVYWQYGNSTDLPTLLHIENPQCHRTIWLSWRKKRYMPETIRSFKEFAMAYFSSITS